MIVRCVKCGVLLTDKKGNKKKPIWWTDSFKMGRKKEFFLKKKMHFADIWQWCENCYFEESNGKFHSAVMFTRLNLSIFFMSKP